MIKVLATGLVLALSTGVAFAQSTQTPQLKKYPRKRPPATRPDDKKADPSADVKPVPTPAAAAATTAPKAAPAQTTPGGALKTDEKAGTKLEKGQTGDFGVSENDERLASIAFRKGNEFLNNGLFPQAVQEYRNALSHWDHPAIHYNLALALINLDQPIEVWDELNRAIEYGEEPLEKDKYDHAKDYLRLVGGQLADIEVSCDKPGAKVSVDGKDVFVAPGRYAAKVRVGKHTFHADKEGYNAQIIAPFIGSNEHFRIQLKLYTAEELTRYKRRWDSAWVPYAVIGAGALVGLAGGALQMSAQSDYDAYNAAVAACRTPTAGCSAATPGINDLKDSGDRKKLLGFIGYGVAGAAIATGTILAVVNRREAYQITAEELAREKVSAQVTPIVSPGVLGAVVQGKF